MYRFTENCLRLVRTSMHFPQAIFYSWYRSLIGGELRQDCQVRGTDGKEVKELKT